MSIFSSLRYCLGSPSDTGNLYAALGFIPFGLFFDFMDGRVARWRKKSSLMGQELDSLADLVRRMSPVLSCPARLTLLTLPAQISFGVAPAVAAFALGVRTPVDHLILTFFALCGLTRLARFNVTVANVPKDGSGKSRYFEGTPIPTTTGFTAMAAYWISKGWILEEIPLGVWLRGSVFEFHPIVGLFLLWGCLMTSKSIKVPKP